MIIAIYRRPRGRVATISKPMEVPSGVTASIENVPIKGQYWDILDDRGEETECLANGFAPTVFAAADAIEDASRRLFS